MKGKPILAIGLAITVAFMAVFAVLMVPAASVDSAPANDLDVVASGLDSPRHMTFGPDGALYVAEAGVGGSSPCIEGGERCAGDTGAVTRITEDSQQRVISGLASLAGAPSPSGEVEGIGPHDVLFDATGTMHVLMGLGASPTNTVWTTGTLHGEPFATIMKQGAGGTMEVVADIGAYELAANPDGGELDTNPFTFVQGDDGTFFVADAGGNSLLSVINGVVSTEEVFEDTDVSFFADFPTNTIPISIPMQAVPTAVEIGPGGDLYVGQLTGFPFPMGAANVYRIPAGGGDAEMYASGFSAITDIDFDEAGNLYVLEMATNGLLAGFGAGDWTGALKRVESGGTVTTVASYGLVAPTGMTIGDDGWIYISNYGVQPGQGQVIRVK